ncbi:hypothetical protein DFH06DRAFT_1484012 [Mycena polygramma]|nr:hypothetical protein DFH06DRAFT_1484012 [Mycena polygramma]
MARHSLTRRCNVMIFTVVFVFFLAPEVMRSYPQTVALADAFFWAGDKFLEGLASGAFLVAACMACSLTGDAYRWLTGAHTEESTPTPAQLEAGTASRDLHELEVLEAEVAGTEPPVASTPTAPGIEKIKLTTGRKIWTLLTSSVVFGYQFFQQGIVSPETPLLDNVSATLLYILRGWEVIFVAFLLLMLGAYVAKSRSRSAAAAEAVAPAEVLFEGTLPEEEETPVVKEDVTGTQKV